MSESLLDFDTWPTGIASARIPANNNARRSEVLAGSVISATTTAQPGSPAELDIYIIPAGATGSMWAGFDEGDVAIFYEATWTAFAPYDGLRKFVIDEGTDWQYIADSSGGWGPATAVGTVNWGTIGGTLSDQTDLQAALAALNRSTVTAVTPSAGTATFDYALGDYFTLAPTANVTTLAFSNLPGAGKGASLMIRFTQDTSARTVAWPASFKWAGGTPGAVSTGSGDIDVIAITTFDNGTTWDATIAKDFS